MNVRCHCSAPPNHPPIANDFGQFNKSFCGIFAPKLGNARKICSPLPTITNNEIAFTQWHSRTASGCSYTARATVSVSSPFVLVISITAPLMQPPSSAAVPAAVVRASRPHSRERGALAPWPARCRRYKISQAVERRIPLIFPVPNLLQNIRHLQVRQVLRLLVANFRRHIQPQWRPVLARERLIVHLIADQSLRMQRRRHVQRLVIIVRASYDQESRRGVGADHVQKIRQPRAAEAPNHIPPFNANMASILPHPRQGLNLRQFVLAGPLHRATHRQGPVFKNYSRILHVISVDREFLERRHLSIRKSRSQMTAPIQTCRCPIAEPQPLLQQRLLKTWNGKRPQSQHRHDLQQFPARYLREPALIHPGMHRRRWNGFRTIVPRLNCFRLCYLCSATIRLRSLRIRGLRFTRVRFVVFRFHTPPSPTQPPTWDSTGPQKLRPRYHDETTTPPSPAHLTTLNCRFRWPFGWLSSHTSRRISQERAQSLH